MRKNDKCAIPINIYRRLWLLQLIENFNKGCYGKTRLQKVAFYSEKDRENRPFSFQKGHHGQYSQELSDTLEQLITMGLVVAEPLSEGEGNKYISTEQGVICPHKAWLDAVSPEMHLAMKDAIEEIGYLSLEEILTTAHAEEEYQKAAPFDILLKANAPESIPINLSPDECEELILALSPTFVRTLQGISKAVKDFDFEKVAAE